MNNRVPGILIVHESRTQALQLRLAFEQQGWRTVCVPSGGAALADMEQDLPDVVAAAADLPDMSGEDLYSRLRTRFPENNTAVLLLGETKPEPALTGESGRLLYLSSPEELISAARSYIASGNVPAELPPAAIRRIQDSRVLAIDDSPTHLEFLTETLRADGYAVEKALSGSDGLKRVAKEKFDCVLVDLIMPDMDGIEVCRRMNSMRGKDASAAAVIIVTSREGREDITRGLEAGADDFVGKSSDLTVLKARLHAVLRRRLVESEHRRLLSELKAQELEATHAKAGKKAAEMRAALADELKKANQELEEANRKIKDTQTHLVQTEKMASLGQLVAGIAHEINNPLAFVLNHLFTIETALGQVASEIGANASERVCAKLSKMHIRLEEMKEGLERMKELVLNLRTFSRLDEGETKVIDIHAGIDSVLLFLRHRTKGRIEVERNYGQVRPVCCSAGQLNQVMMNLISNAVDAIERQGKITISTRETDGQVEIVVRDTGAGIPDAIRDRIFDPFFTTKAVGQGTGLGLAIAYRIIEAHHGAISVRSQPGEGAEFTVRIPLGPQTTSNEKETVGAR